MICVAPACIQNHEMLQALCTYSQLVLGMWVQPAVGGGGGSLGLLALVPYMEAGASAAYMYPRLVRADRSGMVPVSELLLSHLQLCICGGIALPQSDITMPQTHIICDWVLLCATMCCYVLHCVVGSCTLCVAGCCCLSCVVLCWVCCGIMCP